MLIIWVHLLLMLTMPSINWKQNLEDYFRQHDISLETSESRDFRMAPFHRSAGAIQDRLRQRKPPLEIKIEQKGRILEAPSHHATSKEGIEERKKLQERLKKKKRYNLDVVKMAHVMRS